VIGFFYEKTGLLLSYLTGTVNSFLLKSSDDWTECRISWLFMADDLPSADIKNRLCSSQDECQFQAAAESACRKNGPRE
jgi:hypothetical protein